MQSCCVLSPCVYSRLPLNEPIGDFESRPPAFNTWLSLYDTYRRKDRGGDRYQPRQDMPILHIGKPSGSPHIPKRGMVLPCCKFLRDICISHNSTAYPLITNEKPNPSCCGKNRAPLGRAGGKRDKCHPESEADPCTGTGLKPSRILPTPT